MAYAQEEGPVLYDRNINMDNIDYNDLLWTDDFRDKRSLIFVDLDQYVFFSHLQLGLPNHVGVIGFLSLNKYYEEYYFIKVNRIRRRENVHFFVNRNDERHLDNIVYSYRILNENLDRRVNFVFITNDVVMFEGETIRNERLRRCSVFRPSGLMNYIDNVIN